MRVIVFAIVVVCAYVIGWRRGWHAGAQMAINSLTETKNLCDAIAETSRKHHETMAGWSIKLGGEGTEATK